MEGLPRRAAAPRRSPVVAQLADHQLAERVVEIGGIVGAARRLLARIAFVLIALLAEHLQALRLRHAAGVQADRRQEAAVAQQRVADLADMRLGIAIAEAGVPHHLLGIMRPALGEGIADEDPAEHRRRAVGVEELQEMPRHHLVDRGEQQILLARHEGILRLLVPGGIGRRDIIDRGDVLLIRPGGIDIGGVLPVVGRTFLDLRFLGAGDGDEILGDDERPQLRIWRRASATGPSGDLLAFILSMQAGIVWPGANCRQAAASASWLRLRSARPAASSVASGVSTPSVARTIRWNRSAPSAKSPVAVPRCPSSQVPSARTAALAAAADVASCFCKAGSRTSAKAALASPV